MYVVCMCLQACLYVCRYTCPGVHIHIGRFEVRCINYSCTLFSEAGSLSQTQSSSIWLIFLVRLFWGSQLC